MFRTILAYAACLSLVACGQSPHERCERLIDRKVRQLLFERCMEASAATTQHNNGEPHETVRTCENQALYAAYYSSCDPDNRVTEQWLREISQ